jgi:hypothetical protein
LGCLEAAAETIFIDFFTKSVTVELYILSSLPSFWTKDLWSGFIESVMQPFLIGDRIVDLLF